MAVEIETRGLEEMSAFFRAQPEVAERAAQLAINDSARFAQRVGAKQILDEINYPKSYLRGEDNRLSITQFATRGNLEAVVAGRDRATSLARFSSTKVKFGRQHGVRVQVKAKGAARDLPNGFFMQLRNGNVGLAVRVRKGERLRKSRAAVDMGNGVFLLYGPSVDQAFQGVAADVVDSVSDNAAEQFVRQYERLSSNA